MRGNDAQLRGHEGVLSIALNGAPAGNRFVTHEADGVDIGTGVGMAGADLLGRHVGNGSNREAGAGEPL